MLKAPTFVGSNKEKIYKMHMLSYLKIIISYCLMVAVLRKNNLNFETILIIWFLCIIIVNFSVKVVNNC